jgi:hypothetical protein
MTAQQEQNSIVARPACRSDPTPRGPTLADRAKRMHSVFLCLTAHHGSTRQKTSEVTAPGAHQRPGPSGGHRPVCLTFVPSTRPQESGWYSMQPCPPAPSTTPAARGPCPRARRLPGRDSRRVAATSEASISKPEPSSRSDTASTPGQINGRSSRTRRPEWAYRLAQPVGW